MMEGSPADSSDDVARWEPSVDPWAVDSEPELEAGRCPGEGAVARDHCSGRSQLVLPLLQLLAPLLVVMNLK